MNSRILGIRSLLRLPLLRPVPLQGSLRNASSQASTTATSQAAAPKPKPNKSPSSLKRTASASLPIRANPNPTRGAIQPIYTFTTAESYDLTRLRYALPSRAVLFEDAFWTPIKDADNDGPGEAWVFRNGTVVCWGTEEGASREFVDQMVRSAHTAQVSPLNMVETEELEFVIDPAE